MEHIEITEQDLQYILSGKKPPRFKKTKKIALITGIFIVALIAIFLTINFGAVKTTISFWYKTDLKNENSAPQSVSITAPDKPNLKIIQNTLPEITQNHINIPAITLDAPITWQVENTPDKTKNALQNGVIHILGTALPGENGNVFITGHSSDYLWSQGHYKNIFALLGKLAVGDLVYLGYNQKTYLYKIAKIYTTDPNNLTVLSQTNASTLTLMTCTPVGTSLNRLILVANQVFPDPANNTSRSNQNTPISLPKTR